MRILLLFGYVIFKNILKEKYYTHLLKLVVMMHLSEHRQIIPSYIDVVNRLGKSFVINFSKLYRPRHCVSVVHSLIHISDTIYDFGPLHTFSTFNFENDLGRINFKKLFIFITRISLFKRSSNTYQQKYQTICSRMDRKFASDTRSSLSYEQFYQHERRLC